MLKRIDRANATVSSSMLHSGNYTIKHAPLQKKFFLISKKYSMKKVLENDRGEANYFSSDYVSMLEGTVMDGLANKLPLSTDDYT